jgi:hypothetical protein
MFFLDLADTNAEAISDAARFNAKKLDANLKDGLTEGVQKKNLNWDLGKKKEEGKH